MIPPGIPPNRSGWPGGLLDHLRRFKQGDVVHGFPAVFIGDPEVAAHAQTGAYAGSGTGPIEFDEFEYGLITTQTCDIQEADSESPSRPWVQLSPVYDAAGLADPANPDSPRYFNSGHRRLLKRGRGFQYLIYLPDLGNDGEVWIADLRLSVPVDKGWLLEKEPIQVFSSPEERVAVGRRCAMLLDRPAFDARFVENVQLPLVRGLKELAAEDSDLYEMVHDSVYAIGVRTSDNVAMTTAEVWIIQLLPDLPDAVTEWLTRLEAEWLSLAEGTGFNLLPIRWSDLDAMSAAEYVTLTVVPLTNISPDPTWHGGE